MTNTQENTKEAVAKTPSKKGKWDAQKGKIQSLEALKSAEKMTRKFRFMGRDCYSYSTR